MRSVAGDVGGEGEGGEGVATAAGTDSDGVGWTFVSGEPDVVKGADLEPAAGALPRVPNGVRGATAGLVPR